MPQYFVTITGRFALEDWERAGEQFRFRFSERGAYESEGATERFGLFWQPVSMPVDADSAAAAAESQLRAYAEDAHAVGLGPLKGVRADAEETGNSWVAPMHRQYYRSGTTPEV